MRGGEENMKKVLLKSLFVIFVFGLIFSMVGCDVGDTHTSIKEIKEEGWDGDVVEIEIARISTLYGGVTYSESTNNYAFNVYDKSVEKENNGDEHAHISVVVDENDIPFSPETGDFITINRGELQETEEEMGTQEDWHYYKENEKEIIIFANDIGDAEAPADW